MADYGAWAGLGNALTTGVDAYSRAKKARADSDLQAKQVERQAVQDAMTKETFGMSKKIFDRNTQEATPTFDAAPALGLDSAIKLTRGEAVKGAEKRAEIASAKKAASGASAGMRLKPGERYNAKNDTVEAVPGSDLYQAQSGKHGKDFQAKQAATASSNMATSKVDSILADPEAIASQFGGYNAMASQYMNPDAKNKIESLKSNLKAQGLQLMKGGGGIGAISEKEWPIMEGMIATLDPRMSEENAVATLKQIKQKFQDLKTNMDEAYNLEWGNTPFTKSMRTSRGGNSIEDKGANKNKQLAQQILNDHEAGPDDIAWAKAQ